MCGEKSGTPWPPDARMANRLTTVCFNSGRRNRYPVSSSIGSPNYCTVKAALAVWDTDPEVAVMLML